jgi:anti-sigma-K factor RskA
MNYQRQELVERLASEYVLGTLRGRARLRFQAIMQAYLPARREVLWWEQRLAAMAMRLPAIEPPSQVWTRIEERTSTNRTGTTLATRNTLRGWQALAAGLAFVALGLGTLLTVRDAQVQLQAVEPAQIAIVADETAPLWIVNAFPQLQQLRVRALRPITLAPNQAYELWMLPNAGTAPVSLGLLPIDGESTLPLNDTAAQTLEASSTLAVSLEPAGGSPTGAPTGPIVYTAPVVQAPG